MATDVTAAGATGGPAPTEETVFLIDAVEHVEQPWGFDEFICPACERGIPTRKQIRMAIPAKYEHQLNPCFKCPWCSFIFSPRRVEAKVVRR